jgi:HEAT repeat protein
MMYQPLSLAAVLALLLGPLAWIRADGDEKPDPPPAELSPEEKLEVLRRLFDEDRRLPDEERVLRVYEFANAPCKKTVDFLSRLYRDERNTGIHMAATQTLGKIGSLEAIQAIIQNGLPVLSKDTYAVLSVGEALGRPLSPAAEDWFLKKGMVPALRSQEELWTQVIQAVRRFRNPQRFALLEAELARSAVPARLQAALLAGLEGAGSSRSARVTALAKNLARSGNVEVQAAALRCLFAHGGAKHRKEFEDGLRSPHWQVRAQSLALCAKLGHPKLLDHAGKLLADPEPKVQVVAVRALLRRGGIEVIPLLFRALDKSKGRVQDDIADALARLTGRDLGPSSAQWESWWIQNKNNPAELKMMGAEEFSALKAESAQQQTLVYYGLRVLSDNVAFVFDSSESMAERYEPIAEEKKAEEETAPEGTTVVRRPGGGRAGAAGGKKGKSETGVPKIEVAKRELRKVIDGLEVGRRFTIVQFDSIIRDFIPDELGKEREGLERMTPEVRDRARAFIDKVGPAGLTYMLKAIESAFAYEDIETVFLLSDGAPTPESGSMEQILERVRELNQLRGVKINTIGFKMADDEKDFLRRLADENFGVFVER